MHRPTVGETGFFFFLSYFCFYFIRHFYFIFKAGLSALNRLPLELSLVVNRLGLHVAQPTRPLPQIPQLEGCQCAHPHTCLFFTTPTSETER